MRASGAVSCGCLRALLVAVAVGAGAPPLVAQETPVPAFTVSGNGPETYVIISGLVGGVAGFRRIATRLVELGHRVIIIDPYRLSADSSDVSFAALARRVDRVLASHDVTGARMIGHAHGAGVMLRVAASAPERAAELYFLDVGALPLNRTKVFSASFRLVPIIARIPGGRAAIRSRFVRGLRQNSGRVEWLDDSTRHAYTEPMLDNIGKVIALAFRLRDSNEPEPLDSVVARIRVPATLILGTTPRESGPDSTEIAALAPLGANLRVHRLDGVGHFPHEEAPDAVVHLLTATFPVRVEPVRTRPER